MKRYYSCIIAAAALIGLSGCGSNNQAMKESYFDTDNLDTSADPRQDFYQYACGGWIANNPLPDEYSRFGTFNVLAQQTQEQVKQIIEDLSTQEHQSGSVAQKIGDLYNIGMDSARLEREGVQPIQADLDAIKAIASKQEAISYIAQLHRQYIIPFFGFSVGADQKNSLMNIVNLYQGGTNLPDRDYYLNQDDRSKEIRGQYLTHIQNMFTLAGYTAEQAQAAANGILKLETSLAEAGSSREALRDPEANYNKLTVAQLSNWTPVIDWNQYFATLGASNVEELVVGQENFFKKLNGIIANTSLEDMKYYFAWEIINTASGSLSDNIAEESFNFYGRTLTGTQERQPRWKRVVGMLNGVIGEGIGEIYAERHFPEESKQKMLTLVANLQDALKERILQLDWMTDVTKERAVEKLAAFRVKIGYPDKWRDYSGLTVNPDESYWANMKHSNEFDMQYMIDQIGKPVDRDEWHMTPQTVNAYYNPTTNEICFPAAILQPPFFFPQGDDALNYGAIGVVIGHEMTHGFDDQGRMYDKDGNLNDWWTDEDAQRFNERAQGLADYFDQQIVLDTVHANGKLTLGENIADQGGLILSHAAYQKLHAGEELPQLDGFTPEQRFYLAYANVWATNIRPEEILRLTKIDVHSLGLLRVNATLPHIQEFHQAFDVKEGDAMYLSPAQRALVW